MYPANVERFRIIVNSKLAGYDLQGFDFTELSNTILGIIQKESHGNPYALGDPLPGYPVKVPEYWNAVNASQNINNYKSVGIGQSNFAAGTPNDSGYTGTKINFLGNVDAQVSVTVDYFMKQLKRYHNISDAISSYNVGHTHGLTEYVFDVLENVKKFGSDILKNVNATVLIVVLIIISLFLFTI